MSCRVAPGLMEAVEGVTLTVVRTGAAAVTVMTDVPVLVVAPLVAVAVMVAVPTDTPVTRPVVALTVATGLLLEDQEMVAPAKAAPFWSKGEAVSCRVAPGLMEAVGGVTLTVVRTGAATASAVAMASI